jgi:hypothetical protein
MTSDFIWAGFQIGAVKRNYRGQSASFQIGALKRNYRWRPAMFRALAARVQAALWSGRTDTATHALVARRTTMVPHERIELDSGLRTDDLNKDARRATHDDSSA